MKIQKYDYGWAVILFFVVLPLICALPVFGAIQSHKVEVTIESPNTAFDESLLAEIRRLQSYEGEVANTDNYTGYTIECPNLSGTAVNFLGTEFTFGRLYPGTEDYYDPKIEVNGPSEPFKVYQSRDSIQYMDCSQAMSMAAFSERYASSASELRMTDGVFSTKFEYVNMYGYWILVLTNSEEQASEVPLLETETPIGGVWVQMNSDNQRTGDVDERTNELTWHFLPIVQLRNGSEAFVLPSGHVVTWKNTCYAMGREGKEVVYHGYYENTTLYCGEGVSAANFFKGEEVYPGEIRSPYYPELLEHLFSKWLN